jgi:hypothetical protein
MQINTTLKSATKFAYAATAFCLSSFCVNAHATLTNYNVNDTDLVYSSVSDVTWIKDANLLGSLYASQGYDNVVAAIIKASPTITNAPNVLSPTGIHTVSENLDFTRNGRVSWFGAMAFVNYLNSIQYGGSHEWRLPTFAYQSFAYYTPSNGTATGNEYSELYYQELGSIGAIDNTGTLQSGYGIKDTNNNFINVLTYGYWSGTEATNDAPNANAWNFNTTGGYQGNYRKSDFSFAWAVTTGHVAQVPEPAAAWLFISGFLGLSLLRRRHS